MEDKEKRNMGEAPLYYNQCSVLVLSCDKNIGVLKIFLDFFYKNWLTCILPVYIGLEEYNLEYPNCVTLNSKETFWAARVKDYLKRINTPYVLIMLDDFIIEEVVNDKTLFDTINHMMDNPEIVNMTLSNIPDSKNQTSLYKGFYKRHWAARYLLNMQVGVWKTNVLFSLLEDNESPWQTELYGSIRARKLKKYSFYCIVDNSFMPIKYNNGWLIVRGAWNGNEIIRLNLTNYGTEIFDGKKVLYNGFGKISFIPRIIRRTNILLRQFCSWLNIYF